MITPAEKPSTAPPPNPVVSPKFVKVDVIEEESSSSEDGFASVVRRDGFNKLSKEVKHNKIVNNFVDKL